MGVKTPVYVAESNVQQGLQLGADLGQVLHQGQRLLHGGVQQVGDGVALELHLQGFAIVAARAAHIAGYVDIGQKVHLDALQPVALAGFAAAAFHIKTEPAGSIAAQAGFG